MNVVKTPSFELATYERGDSEAERLALVLPGFLSTKDMPCMRSHVDYLAEEQDYLALSFDPPGTWESGGAIADYTTTNYLKAIHELIEHFDNRPTFVMGHSMGGRLALLAAMKRETPITSLAALMTVFDYLRPDNREKRTAQWQATGHKLIKRTPPLGILNKFGSSFCHTHTQ